MDNLNVPSGSTQVRPGPDWGERPRVHAAADLVGALRSRLAGGRERGAAGRAAPVRDGEARACARTRYSCLATAIVEKTVTRVR